MRSPNRSRRNLPLRKAITPDGPERAVGRVINQGWGILDAGLFSQRAQDMIQARSAAGLEAALPWDQFTTHLGQATAPMGEQIGRSISQELGTIGSIQGHLGFTATDALATRYAQQQSGQMIRNITDSQLATIRGITGKALNGDYTIRQAAQQIRNGIGLHPAWAAAVQHYQDRLLAQPAPKGMSNGKWMDTIDARTTRYRDRLIRTRSLTIARTEIQTAQNLGRYATWADSIGQGLNSQGSLKEWSPGPGACPICLDLEGEKVPWDGNFSNGSIMPPAHPNCRCSAVLVPPEAHNQVLNPRPISWTSPEGDRATYGLADLSAGQEALDTAGETADTAATADAGDMGGDGTPEQQVPELSAYEKDLQALQAMATATRADDLTYETTLHWSDDKLMSAITKYADDPEAVDKILGIIDQREVVAAQRAGEQQALVDYKPITEETNPLLNPAVRPARQLTADQRVEEEYTQYVGNQIQQALDYTNGVLFNKANLAAAKAKGVDEYALFTGQYKTASKYASDELQAFWHEQGRETLGSFRYRALGRASDRWYADVVRNNGLMRGMAGSDRSQF